MKTRSTFLRAGLLAAYFSTWGWSGYEPGKLLAQPDALIAGNEGLLLSPAVGSLTSLPITLPTHPVGTPQAYHGEIPQRSQHIRATGDGRILFFAIDGNVYDGNGWLIADARAPGCLQCVARGVMEFVSIPVPGNCGLFYLIAAEPKSDNYNGTHLQWSVLDMNAINTRFPANASGCSKMGRILDLDLGNNPHSELATLYPQFLNFNEDYANSMFFEWYTTGIGGVAVTSFNSTLTSSHMGRLFADATGKSISPQIRVVESGNNGEHLLFLILKSRIYVYRVTDHGIYSVQPVPSKWYVQTVDDFTDTDPSTFKAFMRDADAIMTSNGVAFAMVDEALFDYPTYTNMGNIVTMRFNSNTGVLLNNSVQTHTVSNVTQPFSPYGPTTNIPGGLRGCSFRPDGQGLYVTGEFENGNQQWIPYLGHLDLLSGQATDLTNLIPTPVNLDLMRSRTYRNKTPNGSSDAVYFPLPSGIAALTNVASPITAQWQSNIFTATVSTFDPTVNYGVNYNPYYLNIGVSNDSYLTTANKAACCTFLGQTGSGVVEGLEHTGTASWSDTNNPYGNASTLTFNCDLVVKPGAKLTLNNMTVRFAPGVRVIVERGGYLDMRNTRFTSLQCPNTRWRGVEVRGTISQPQTWAAYPTNQGRMIMVYNSIIENAEVGVLLGATQTSSNVQGFSGGILNANSSSFVNCIEGVRMMRYQNFAAGNSSILLGNRSNFAGVTFKVDANYPQPYNFKHHVYMNKVSGINFSLCHFRNEWSDTFFTNMGSLDLGYGIYSMDAEFKVQGICNSNTYPCPQNNIVPSTFEGFDHAIHAMSSLTTRKFAVQNTTFLRNICGVYADGVVGFSITNNIFGVGGRNVPMTNPLETVDWAPYHRGIFSTYGYGFAIDDNRLLRQGPIKCEGIVVNNSGNHDDLVFRNFVQGMNAAYVGEGWCADELAKPLHGLQFRCNANSYNGYNIWNRLNVTGNAFIDSRQTIRTVQGELDFPAGNTFDRDDMNLPVESDLHANGNLNVVNYIGHSAGSVFDPLDIDATYFAKTIVATAPTNVCTQRTKAIGGGNIQHMAVQDLSAMIASERTVYADLRYVYDNMIDGGSTDELVVEIMDTWPAEVRDLRSKLMSKSPYLSTEALFETVSKNILPNAIVLEICLANPEATSKEGFVKWMEYEAPTPMPEYMLGVIEASWHSKTVRFYMEEAIGIHSSNMSHGTSILVQKLYADSIGDPVDSIRMVWHELRRPSARYAEANALVEQGNFTAAKDVVNLLPIEHKVKNLAEAERVRMIDLITFLEQVTSSGRNESELNTVEIQQLESAIALGQDRPGAWARNILCFYYDHCVPPVTGWDDSNPKSNRPEAPTSTIETKPSLHVFPNPAETYVTFGYKLESAPTKAFLTVKDATGRMIATIPISLIQAQVAYDPRDLAKGLYNDNFPYPTDQ